MCVIFCDVCAIHAITRKSAALEFGNVKVASVVHLRELLLPSSLPSIIFAYLNAIFGGFDNTPKLFFDLLWCGFGRKPLFGETPRFLFEFRQGVFLPLIKPEFVFPSVVVLCSK